MNNVSWSEGKERDAIRAIWITWIAAWVCIVASVASMLVGQFVISAWLFVPIVIFVLDVFYQHRRLMAMLLNKPRSTANLTHWIKLRAWQIEMHCACGQLVPIVDAKWYANSADPGGGRFAMVCACGIGYYKLIA